MGSGQSPERLSEGLGDHRGTTERCLEGPWCSSVQYEAAARKKTPLLEITQPIRGQDATCTQGSTVLEPCPLPLHHFPYPTPFPVCSADP